MPYRETQAAFLSSRVFYCSHSNFHTRMYCMPNWPVLLFEHVQNESFWRREVIKVLSLIVKNLCDFVTPPVPQHNDIQPLTPEQVRCLLEAAHGDKLEAFITVGGHFLTLKRKRLPAVKLSQHRVAPACSMWFDCTGGGEHAAQRCVSSADGFGSASDRR